MKLVVTHALRLVRKDLTRLSDVHRSQFVEAIAPGQPEIAESLIETGSKDDADDDHGLVYARFHDDADPKRAFEGWLLDMARAPSKRTMPDGGAFFLADTTDPAGVDMTQSSLECRAAGAEALFQAITAMLPNLVVVSRGAAMKQNPPFAHAVAPKPKKPVMETGTLTLRVVYARRYIAAELRNAPEQTRFQFLHAVRPLFATPTPEGMEQPHVLGGLYSSIDPGPVPGPPNLFGPNRRGLVYVRFADTQGREFDGWFFTTTKKEASAYWPSPRATLGDGRILVGGSIEHTGVEVAKGKVRVATKRVLPVADALARGLRKLGLTFDVEVSPVPTPGDQSYFEREVAGA